MPELRTRHHRHCIVCSPDCAHGLQLKMSLDAEGKATGTFDCDPRFEGYPNLLHGGVISALLDGAMTNCLFLHHHAAVTAELNIRFRHPVLLGSPARLRAWITETDPPLFRLRAELIQNNQTKATARSTFMLAPSLIPPEAHQ